MKKSRLFTTLALLAAATGISAAPAAAQSSSTPPIVVKQKPSKAVWMKVTVIHSDWHSIMVSERDNERMVHTFTYSEKVADEMQKYIDGGSNFQNGDQVEILHMPDKMVAIKIKGQPTPPR